MYPTTNAPTDRGLRFKQAIPTQDHFMEHACIHLLEQALRTGEQELDALKDGQVEQASAWEEERSRLTHKAIKLSDDVPLDVLLVEFHKLRDIQKRLIQAVNDLRQNWQQEFTRARGESRRLAGYKQATAHALSNQHPKQ